jgi:hypothetical protein
LTLIAQRKKLLNDEENENFCFGKNFHTLTSQFSFLFPSPKIFMAKKDYHTCSIALFSLNIEQINLCIHKQSRENAINEVESFLINLRNYLELIYLSTPSNAVGVDERDTALAHFHYYCYC